MPDKDRLDEIHLAQDALEVLIEPPRDSQYWVAGAELAIHAQALERLRGLGIDVSELQFRADEVARDRGVARPTFETRCQLALRSVRREISKEELVRRSAVAAVTPPAADVQPDPNTVFLVHGQDRDAVEMVRALLREVGLSPIDFEDARRVSGKPLPYVGDVLDVAFANARAVLVLFTPDERVELVERLRDRTLPIVVEHQPRPNVLIEAGIALISHPDRTVIVEMGEIRNISDLAGRHMVRMTADTPAKRSEIVDRLKDAGCDPVRDGSKWMEVGKIDRPTWA